MWGVLALSLLSLNAYKLFSLLLLIASVVLGVANGVIDWPAFGLFTIVGLLYWLKVKWAQKSWCRIVTESCLVVLSVVLLYHFWPGFHNPVVLNSVITGPFSTPYTMYFNFDKAMVPFLLVLSFPRLFKSDFRYEVSYGMWGLLFLSVPFILVLAVLLGGIKPEVHFPEWLPKFILSNLFFVSLAEEAFFRGYLQQRLSMIVHPFVALFIASVLFGLYHYSGGLLLVLFAMLSGVIYGMAWMFSGRLWVATFFHFGLNLCHLLFFTYPFLKNH
ncbi:CPBP family intramembrane metalloprotease [Escherichia coli]